MTPSEYVANLSAHKQATYRITSTEDGIKEQITYEGKEYTWAGFAEAYNIRALEIKQENNFKGENSDRTKAWMED